MNQFMDGGLYNLVIHLSSDEFIQVGKLSGFLFRKGYYVYTGSARRGLKARIERHKRREKKLYWHIDYFLESGTVIDVRTYTQGVLTECELNKKIFHLEGAEIPAPGFGSSDCNCPSHLVSFRNLPKIEFYV